MKRNDPPRTRRQFLKRAAGVSVAGSLAGISASLRSLEAEEPQPAEHPAPYPSHGPTQRFLANSREIIREKILPPPAGRRLNQHVFVSSRLENVFYVPLGRRPRPT